MGFLGMVIVLAACLLNDWCIVNHRLVNRAPAPVVPLIFHGGVSIVLGIYFVSYALALTGSGLVWAGLGPWYAAAAFVFFFFLSPVVTLPILESVGFVADKATRDRYLQQ